MPDASGPDLPPRQPEYGACFFLSYAHTPRVFDDGRDPNYWVHQFYRDLCTELVNLDSDWHRAGPPGFIDGDMDYGADWRRQLAAQLARCRVFIPLYSRSYFTRENCGREWSVFRDRQMAHMAQTGTPNEAILPVLWQPPRREDLPAVASALQIAPLGRAGRYLERGLYELIRLDRDGEYVEAVINLAEHLDRKARAAPPPGPEVEFDDVRPAFPGAGAASDVQRLYITVSAPDRGSLPAGRDPSYYGDSPDQWNPYHPELDEPLLVRAEQVARGLGYEPVRSVLNRNSAELRPTARPLGRPETSPDGPGIMLVDPWTAHETAGTRHIAQFDHTRKPWIRVMVPWNRGDRQTAEQETVLRANLEMAMPWALQSWRRSSRPGTRDLATLEQFGHALPEAVEQARRHFIKAAHPRPPGGEFPPRPSLGGTRPRPPAAAEREQPEDKAPRGDTP
jgi:FxsC-like protein